MGTEAQKAANTAVAAGEMPKRRDQPKNVHINTREVGAGLVRQVKEFGAFGITIGGGMRLQREMSECFLCFGKGFVGSILKATETQKQDVKV